MSALPSAELPSSKRLRSPWRRLLTALLVVGLAGGAAALVARRDPARPVAARVNPPARLADTGLYLDFASKTVDLVNLPYSPQYPLWSDGAAKRRWIRLPAGRSIDASNPDAWSFPVGTRLWKEFSFGLPSQRVETRYMERLASGGWLFATYRWTPDGSDAVLAPESGVSSAFSLRPGVSHALPSRNDCLACHGGRATPVLGVTALQLSPDRDPMAPHAETPEAGSLDLLSLERRGLVTGLSRDLLSKPPRIDAPTPRARAALGYLHANCGSCHSKGGPIDGLQLAFDVSLRSATPRSFALETTRDVPSKFRVRGGEDGAHVRLVPGVPRESVLFRRVASREPLTQMPPLGTRLVDVEARDLLEAWIREDVGPASPVPSRALLPDLSPSDSTALTRKE